MKGRKEPLEDRFWQKVEKTEGCWIWTGSKTTAGYGNINGGTRIGVLYAHRISYELAHGPIPAGKYIDHLCFNRGCVNPSHMRLATPAENSQNRASAGEGSKSGIRGVHWDKRTKSWGVRAQKDRRTYWGGRFSNINDAAEAAKALHASLYSHHQKGPIS